MKNIPLIVLFCLIALGISYTIYQSQPAPLESTKVYPKPKLLPDFELTDHSGNAFGNKQLLGKWSVIFFGFTYCPDICPTTMAALSQVANKLPAEISQQVQFVFVSVDPERDTLERLAEYIPFYHQDFIAITGEHSQLQKFSFSLGAVYMKVPMDDSYTMSHSGTVFIVDPEGRRYGVFSKSATGAIDVELIAQDLQSIVQ